MYGSVMYAESLPAFLSMAVTLIWFSMAIPGVVNNTPSIARVWATMAVVTLLAVSVFFFSPIAVWFVLAAQVLLSVAILAHRRQSPTFRQRPHQMKARSSRIAPLGERETLRERAVGE